MTASDYMHHRDEKVFIGLSEKQCLYVNKFYIILFAFFSGSLIFDTSIEMHNKKHFGLPARFITFMICF